MQPEVFLLPQWIASNRSVRSAANALIDRFSPSDAYSALVDEVPLFASFALRAELPLAPSYTVEWEMNGTRKPIPLAETLYGLIGNPQPVGYIEYDVLLVLNPHYLVAQVVFVGSNPPPSGQSLAVPPLFSYWPLGVGSVSDSSWSFQTGPFLYATPSGRWTLVSPPGDADEIAEWYVGADGYWVSGAPGAPILHPSSGGLVAVYAPRNYASLVRDGVLWVNGRRTRFEVEPVWTVLEEWRLRFGLERKSWWSHRHLLIGLLSRRHAWTSVSAPWWGIGADLGLNNHLHSSGGYVALPWDDVVDAASERSRTRWVPVVLDELPVDAKARYPDVRYWLQGRQILEAPTDLTAVGVAPDRRFTLWRDRERVTAIEMGSASDIVVCRRVYCRTIGGAPRSVWDVPDQGWSPCLMDLV